MVWFQTLHCPGPTARIHPHPEGAEMCPVQVASHSPGWGLSTAIQCGRGRMHRPPKGLRDSRNLSRLRNSRPLALLLDTWTLGSQPKAGRNECKVTGLGGDVSIFPPHRSGLSQRNVAKGPGRSSHREACASKASSSLKTHPASASPGPPVP